jgi:hypothetical protein
MLLVAIFYIWYHTEWLNANLAIIFLNSINQLIFVMVKCGVLFEVRAEWLNIT